MGAFFRNNIILGELLIKGTFARIYKGALQDGTNVLVKTVTGKSSLSTVVLEELFVTKVAGRAVEFVEICFSGLKIVCFGRQTEY